MHSLDKSGSGVCSSPTAGYPVEPQVADVIGYMRIAGQLVAVGLQPEEDAEQ